LVAERAIGIDRLVFFAVLACFSFHSECRLLIVLGRNENKVGTISSILLNVPSRKKISTVLRCRNEEFEKSFNNKGKNMSCGNISRSNQHISRQNWRSEIGAEATRPERQ
jgi:ribosomal protein S4E